MAAIGTGGDRLGEAAAGQEPKFSRLRVASADDAARQHIGGIADPP